MNTLDKYKGPSIKKPMDAIRAHCLGCSQFYEHKVRGCENTHCCLYPFRTGTNPYGKRDLPESTRQAMKERFLRNKEAGKAKKEERI